MSNYNANNSSDNFNHEVNNKKTADSWAKKNLESDVGLAGLVTNPFGTEMCFPTDEEKKAADDLEMALNALKNTREFSQSGSTWSNQTNNLNG